jgi:hypothetical protein
MSRTAIQQLNGCPNLEGAKIIVALLIMLFSLILLHTKKDSNILKFRSQNLFLPTS